MPKLIWLASLHRGPVRRRRRKGMTLVEIIIVVVILGSLFTLIAVNVSGQFQEAQVELSKASISKVEQALNMYAAKHKGKFPTTSDGLEGAAKYFATGNVMKDAWDNDFQYFSPGTHGDHAYEIISLGADGKEGGDDNDADINSWDMNE